MAVIPAAELDSLRAMAHQLAKTTPEQLTEWAQANTCGVDVQQPFVTSHRYPPFVLAAITGLRGVPKAERGLKACVSHPLSI